MFPVMDSSPSWLMVSTHLTNMKVSWDDYYTFMEKYKSCSSHHQPVYHMFPTDFPWFPGHKRGWFPYNNHVPVTTNQLGYTVTQWWTYRKNVENPSDLCRPLSQEQLIEWNLGATTTMIPRRGDGGDLQLQRGQKWWFKMNGGPHNGIKDGWLENTLLKVRWFSWNRKNRVDFELLRMVTGE